MNIYNYMNIYIYIVLHSLFHTLIIFSSFRSFANYIVFLYRVTCILSYLFIILISGNVLLKKIKEAFWCEVPAFESGFVPAYPHQPPVPCQEL
jgi:hypothetical protein